MYPTVTRSNAEAFVRGRFEGTLSEHDLKVTHAEEGAVDLVEDIEDALHALLDSWSERDLSLYGSTQARDSLEGELAIELHQAFVELPAYILTDRDFWRFCAAYLYDFILWRQPSKSVQSLLHYFGAASNGIGRDCVPHRMFDRAHIAHEGGFGANAADPYALARIGASDVWKSHILRVANGDAPRVVHEMLLDVQDGKLKTDAIRPFVKNLRRVRSNVLFEVLDQQQARALIDRESDRTRAEVDSQNNHHPND